MGILYTKCPRPEHVVSIWTSLTENYGWATHVGQFIRNRFTQTLKICYLNPESGWAAVDKVLVWQHMVGSVTGFFLIFYFKFTQSV